MLTLEQAKDWYQHTDAVHDFSHIERVYRMAERLALDEEADLEIVRAAALLHDADGTTPGSDSRLEHHLRSAELAGRVGLQTESRLYNTASAPTASAMIVSRPNPLKPGCFLMPTNWMCWARSVRCA
jgi:hypothetical protein